jgi:UDP-N-acetylmuramoyl-tripeptide--D-alanyl-D-alanine ligase
MISIESIYRLYQAHPIITTDSRKVKEGSIFFALKGLNFDGNAYAAEALAKGAVMAVVDNPQYHSREATLLVDDVLETLQALALHHRRQFDIPLLAIAGSNGKTTTKELIAEVLKQRYQTHFTPGNLNNYIGLPLTLLQMPIETEVAVIELGANRQGEIAELCRICEPTHGLITNIGMDHLEGFGGLEGVKKANKELFDYLAQKKGVALMNTDEPFLKELASNMKRIIPYEQSQSLDPTYAPIEICREKATPFLSLSFLNEKGEKTKVDSQLYGAYNFSNLMAAVAVGKYFKVPCPGIKAALENYTPQSNRSQLIQQEDNLIILDAYNANPSSMNAALDSLSELEGYKEKVAILGEMKELGEYSREEHRKLLMRLQKMGITQAFLLGEEFKELAQPESGIIHFSSLQELKAHFLASSFKETAILVKGSRANKLEDILDQ